MLSRVETIRRDGKNERKRPSEKKLITYRLIYEKYFFLTFSWLFFLSDLKLFENIVRQKEGYRFHGKWFRPVNQFTNPRQYQSANQSIDQTLIDQFTELRIQSINQVASDDTQINQSKTNRSITELPTQSIKAGNQTIDHYCNLNHRNSFSINQSIN